MTQDVHATLPSDIGKRMVAANLQKEINPFVMDSLIKTLPNIFIQLVCQ